MTEIKKYTKKDGTTAYKFRVYLGTDPRTGKDVTPKRSGFKTKNSAKAALRKLEFDFSNGNSEVTAKPVNYTFEQVYNEWFDGYKNTVRVSTWYKKKKIFENHMLPAFGKYRIKSITPHQIQKELNKWFDETTNNFKPWFYYTSALFNYAIMQGYITDNPCKRVVLPKKTEYEDDFPNFWDKNQLKTFFSYIYPDKEPERYTLFRVLAFTGIRRGECLALRWDDFDAKKKTLSIERTLTQGEGGKQIIQNTKTRKSKRTLSLDDTTVATLKKWRVIDRKILLHYGFNINDKDQLIFHSRTNNFKSLNTPKKWLDLITKRMKADKVILPKLTIHGFRHTHASALFSAGATIKEVQERLGHADAQTTLNIYVHVTKNQNKEVAKKLVNFLDF